MNNLLEIKSFYESQYGTDAIKDCIEINGIENVIQYLNKYKCLHDPLSSFWDLRSANQANSSSTYFLIDGQSFHVDKISGNTFVVSYINKN